VTTLRSVAVSRSLWSAVAVLAVITGLLSFIWISMLTQRLWVFSEARYYLHDPTVFDPVRFLVAPVLEWGSGRLTGIGVFQTVGRACGFDAACVNASGSGLVAIAAVLLMLHAWQLTRSRLAALSVTTFWVLSPPVLGVAMWQATWFDMVATSAALATCIWAWHILGRPVIGGVLAVTFVSVTVALLAVTFNAKEWTYYLVGALPIIAVIRGWSIPLGVRRNALLMAVPVAYAVWFIVRALTHIDPDYAVHGGSGSIPDGIVDLLRLSLGLGRAFMGIWQDSPALRSWQGVAVAAYVTTALLFVAGALLYLRRSCRLRLRDLGPEIYVGAAAAVTFTVAARGSERDAYYMVFPWAMLLLFAAVVLRRISCATVRPRLTFATVGVVFAIGSLSTYAGHLGPGGSYQVLVDGSARMRDLAGTLRTTIDTGSVGSVWWAAAADTPGAQYVLRGIGGPTVGPEIWPWLVDGLERPTVEPATEESLARSAAGDLVVVMDRDYRAVLITFEGRIVAPIP